MVADFPITVCRNVGQRKAVAQPTRLFILAGGPLVESTHGNLKFTAPLSAITAAVVGVILNLAVFFAYHVFWPQGFEGVSTALPR